jgi:hypothetical protein
MTTESKIRPSESAGNGSRLHVATVENGAEQLVPQTAPGPDADRQANGHPKPPKSDAPDYSSFKGIRIVPDHLVKEGSLHQEVVPVSKAYGEPGSGEVLTPTVRVPEKGARKAGAPTINRLQASHEVGSRTFYDQAPQPAPEAATSVAENSRLGERLQHLEEAVAGLTAALQAQQTQPAKKAATVAKVTKTEAVEA